jgi:D-3-phosphoglycerate dehydrogenase
MNQRWKAVRTDRELECQEIDAGLRERQIELVTLPDGISEDKLIEAVRDADLLLMCYAPISARVIAAAPKLKGIVKYGVGIDAIDIPAAIARGIPVVNVPEYAEETVAEGAFALMIALAKKLKPIGREMTEHGWAWPTAQWRGVDLSGRTLGIVGVGKIGRSLARMASGFRMRVIGYSPHTPDTEFKRAGVERCAELARMKPTAFLINVARGAIVDEAALVAALQEKRIAGAALDVYSQEPVTPSGHPMSALYAMDNVILFPHLTFYTDEAMRRLTDDTLARCFEILEGRPVLIKSHDPRLRAQKKGVVFVD